MRILNVAAGVLLIAAGIYCLCNQDVALLSAGLLLGIFLLLSGVAEIVVFAAASGVMLGSGWHLPDGSVGQRGGHGHDGRHRISAGGRQFHCLRLHFQNKGHLIGRHCCGAADTTPPCFT